MKFKDFLLKENFGLGNLGVKMDKIFSSQTNGNNLGGAFVSDQFDNIKPDVTTMDHPLWLPDTDMTIPSTEKTGRITVLLRKRNPIFVRLSDGTEAHFTYDEFKRIQGNPEVGKVMTIIFQRHPHDAGTSYSKIDRCVVHN